MMTQNNYKKLLGYLLLRRVILFLAFYEDLNRLKQADYNNDTYDANGNMKSGGGRTFTYDYDNRPTSIVYNGSAVISVYDESGQRVKKKGKFSIMMFHV